MEYFVGLDVSLRSCAMCVVDNRGKVYLERELCLHLVALRHRCSANGGVKTCHCGGAKVGQFGVCALERAALT
ncbi:hypothetical protein DA792_09840 [Celeribacter baekdonensis]|uniref:Transposase n=1 Tax=Celeribacter baekdonensis TaxID=875171 RepID=A0A2R4M2A7_9RHOB|nr:hypothetical protein DA792_09840 [Celeribacter baekdonensis]